MQPPRAPLIVLVAAVAAMAPAPQAPAGPIIVTFEGHLTETLSPASIIARGYDPSIAVGAAFSGTFSYDPETAADQYPADLGFSRFLIGGSLAGSVGEVDFEARDLVMSVRNDQPIGGMGPLDELFVAAVGGNLGGQPLPLINVRLIGDIEVLADDRLPTSLFLDDFMISRYFSLSVPDFEGTIVIASGSVESLSVVPEPSSLLLTATLILLLGSTGQNKRQRRHCISAVKARTLAVTVSLFIVHYVGSRADAAAPAVNHGPFQSIQVNVDADQGDAPVDAGNEPSIAIHPLDTSLIAIGWRRFEDVQADNYYAGVAYSTDAGRTWSEQAFVDVLAGQPLTPRSDPVLDYSADGKFYYYSLNRSTFPRTCDMFISTDGGQSWTMDTDPTPIGGDKPWIAVDRTAARETGTFTSIGTGRSPTARSGPAAESTSASPSIKCSLTIRFRR